MMHDAFLRGKRGLMTLFCLGMLLVAHTEQARAQNTTTIPVLKGERWWGVFVANGPMMPFKDPFKKVDLATYAKGQTTPFLISSLGRYLWSPEPFSIAYTGSNFEIDSPHAPVKVMTGGKTLREAYLVCCHKNFPPKGAMPAMELFTRPIYNATAELGCQPTADELRGYADQIVASGYPVGTLVVPSGWQTTVGSLTPSPEFYGDFENLLNEFHAMGFKVMLTITPFVSSDGPIYRHYRQQEQFFLHDAPGKMAIVKWDAGYSAVYDLTQEAVFDLMRGRLDTLRTMYGVDGFLFDCSDVLPQLSLAQGGAQAYLKRWTDLGSGYDLAQYTVSRGDAFAPYIHNLQADIPFGWDFLKRSLADLLNANLLGYPYSTIGADVTNREGMLAMRGDLPMRYLQLLALLPVMNIEFAPWKIADPAVAAAYKATLADRERLQLYTEKLLRESSITAEPLIRHMEYSFPRNGFTDCDDQFMLGNKYLVAPILAEGSSRMVRFPRGVWIAPNGRRYRGPLVTTVQAAENRVLIFESAK